jgi:hypothetical protein
VVSFDLDPTKDDFILLSTDGIFQSMSIAEIVSPPPFRPISSPKSTVNSKRSRVPTRSSAA